MDKDVRNEGMWEKIDGNREFLKCPDLDNNIMQSDQEKKLQQPPLCKEPKGEVIKLSADFSDAVTIDSYTKLLDIRRSERVYDKDAVMTHEQLAFLLWSTQGVQEIKVKIMQLCVLFQAVEQGIHLKRVLLQEELMVYNPGYITIFIWLI